MQITDIKFRKMFFDDGPMKAIVSVTFDNELALHDVKVIHTKDKYFIVMPSRKNPDNTFRDIVHPINSEFRQRLESAVLEAYYAEKEREEAVMALSVAEQLAKTASDEPASAEPDPAHL